MIPAMITAMIPAPWRRRRQHGDWPERFARVFRGEDGRAVLAKLAGDTLNVAGPPDESAEARAYREGRRAMVLYICQLVRQGDEA